MPRNQRGMFDPDYRRAVWNQSKYAPKNRRAWNITQTAFMLTILLCIPVYFILRGPMTANAYTWVLEDARHRTVDRYFITQVLSPANMTGAMVAFVVVWGAIAILLRRREWRRLTRQQIVEQEQTPVGINPMSYSLAALSPREFEEEVARIIERQTGCRAVVCGGAGDGGIDIRVYKGSRLVGIVQCKRYDPAKFIPPLFVRELATVRAQVGVTAAYLVTTARFTYETRQMAHELGIRLLDGNDLQRIRAEQSREAAVTQLWTPPTTRSRI